jgi:hypothetical protein
VSLASALVKLRVLTHPKIGFAEGEAIVDDEVEGLHQLTEFFERSVSTIPPVDDPLIAMIRERHRLREAAEEIKERADQIKSELPEDVREGKVRIAILSSAGEDDFHNEESLQDFFSLLKLAAQVFACRKTSKDDNAIDAAMDRSTSQLGRLSATAYAELRAGLERINEAREASGYPTLEREAEELCDKPKSLTTKFVAPRQTRSPFCYGSCGAPRTA